MGYTQTVIVLLAFCLATSLAQSLTVTLPTYGTLQGYESTFDGVSVNTFVGIPYAAPPVGDLRFQYPQQAASFSGVFNASTFGNVCPQLLNGQFSFPNPTLSEDCLTLNIWSPNTTGSKPVLFWMHAGAYIQGSGSEFRYHGTNLAAQEDIVVVTINYRLGAFGSLAHPSLDATYNNSGTYTLADQFFALQWVIDNIQFFNGDASRITVGGISAGAASTVYLLANPDINLNIAQAIVASADPIGQAQSKDSGLNQGLEVASLLYCNGTDAQIIACLRNATSDQYINLAPYAVISRVSVDMEYLMDSPYNLIINVRIRQVPTFFGNSLDEATAFIYTSQVAPLAQPAYRPFLANFLNGYLPGLNTYSVFNTYPCGEYNADDCRVAASVAVSDATIFCQTTLFAEPYANFGYVFAYRPSYVPAEQGVPHLADIPYHFNSLNLTDFQYDQDDQIIANYVSRYFGAFIKSGDPNFPGEDVAFPDFRDANGTLVRSYYQYPLPTEINDFKTFSDTPACQYWFTAYGQLAANEMMMSMSNSSAAGPGAQPTPSPCPSFSPSPCPPPNCPSISPSACPPPNCPSISPSPCPSSSGCPVPLPCPNCPSGSGSTNINFYFADMLSGVKAEPSSSSS